MIRAATAIVILLTASSSASALIQDPAATEALSLDYRPSVGVPLFAGAIASVALPPLIYKSPPPCRWCDGARIDVIDRWARGAKWEKPCRAGSLSYATLGAAAAVALGPMSHEANGEDWLVSAGAVTDSVAATIVLTQLVKYTVRRARPSEDTCHPGHAKEMDRNLSFFSGHTALAFAFISSAQETAHLRGKPTSDWVWVGGGVAAATGYFRMAAGRHYLIDVLTGAGVGYAMGRLIPRLVTQPKETEPVAVTGRFRPQPTVAVFAYTRPLGAEGRATLQLGKGPGRSVQIGVAF
jgi:membrane-associated phospholipid phosphatase